MTIKEENRLINKIFSKFNAKEYIIDKKINELYKTNQSELESQLENKIKQGLYDAIDPNNNNPLPVEIDDLSRIHYLATSRKATTIMEFGTGKSSLALAHALEINKCSHQNFIEKNIRRAHAFELHSIDDDDEWLNNTKKTIPEKYHDIIHFHYCPTTIESFNGRLCTYYNNLPNISPDLIYLDGPSQYSPKGNLRGLSTADMDRMPMSADILTIEHFLTPGTLIIVDGRTANARFLKCNLQRDWLYAYSEKMDQHFFELKEKPLGIYNKEYINFSLGKEWLEEI